MADDIFNKLNKLEDFVRNLKMTNILFKLIDIVGYMIISEQGNDIKPISEDYLPWIMLSIAPSVTIGVIFSQTNASILHSVLFYSSLAILPLYGTFLLFGNSDSGDNNNPKANVWPIVFMFFSILIIYGIQVFSKKNWLCGLLFFIMIIMHIRSYGISKPSLFQVPGTTSVGEAATEGQSRYAGENTVESIEDF